MEGELAPVIRCLVRLGQVRDQSAAIDVIVQKRRRRAPIGEPPNRVATGPGAAVVTDAVEPLHDQRFADPPAIDLDPEPLMNRRKVSCLHQSVENGRFALWVPSRLLLLRVVNVHHQLRWVTVQRDITEHFRFGNLLRRRSRGRLVHAPGLKQPTQQARQCHKQQ